MLYDIALFLHIAFAIAVFASLTLDWLAVANLRAAAGPGQARTWVGVLETSAAFGPWARVGVLVAGLSLAIAQWSWSWPGWIVVGLAAWVALVLLGEPLTGKDLRRMREAVRDEGEATPAAPPGFLHDPRLWSSVLGRVGLGLGIVFVMTAKPPLPLAALAVVAGAALGLTASRSPAPAVGRGSVPAADPAASA